MLDFPNLNSPDVPPSPLPLSRREAIQRILVASALAASFDLTSFGAEEGRTLGSDPNLLKKEIPWPRVLTDAEKRTVTALADLIIPADEFGPAASTVGVPDFIDEWVSAPYPQMQGELKTIRTGLAWIDGEAQKRFGKSFAECAPEQQTALVDDIVKEGADARKQAYGFFKLFRDRVAGGYYSTKEGWKAIGYTGNMPMGFFQGPPRALLEKLGVA
jgi:gluconate 2-dehydrogenase subunit 3-like protein